MLNLDLPPDFLLLPLDGVGVTTVGVVGAVAFDDFLEAAAGDSLTFSGGCSLLLGAASGISLLSSAADFWSDGAGLF